MITTGATVEMLAPVSADGECLTPEDRPGFRVCQFFPPDGGRATRLVTKYVATEDFAGGTQTLRVPLDTGEESWGDLDVDGETGLRGS